MYYEVTWFEILEAESHEEVAQMARTFQRDPSKIPTRQDTKRA